jgi:hypothetical protein
MVRPGLIVIGVLSLALACCATVPTPREANDAVLALRKYGSWAWAVGIALIWADLVLPVPQTVVIAALGIIYALLASSGSLPAVAFPLGNGWNSGPAGTAVG